MDISASAGIKLAIASLIIYAEIQGLATNNFLAIMAFWLFLITGLVVLMVRFWNGVIR